jgi:transposase InsO family protein
MEDDDEDVPTIDEFNDAQDEAPPSNDLENALAAFTDTDADTSDLPPDRMQALAHLLTGQPKILSKFSNRKTFVRKRDGLTSRQLNTYQHADFLEGLNPFILLVDVLLSIIESGNTVTEARQKLFSHRSGEPPMESSRAKRNRVHRQKKTYDHILSKSFSPLHSGTPCPFKPDMLIPGADPPQAIPPEPPPTSSPTHPPTTPSCTVSPDDRKQVRAPALPTVSTSLLGDLLEASCLDIFPPTPITTSTSFFKTDFVVPDCFDSHNRCHTLLADAKTITDVERPNGSKHRLRYQLYSRARIRAIRRIIGGLNSVSVLGRASSTIARQPYKRPLFYDNDRQDDFSTTDDAARLPGHKLLPQAAFSAVTHPLFISRHHAILDTGASVHCLTSDMPIFNARLQHRQMTNANGKKTLITHGGDTVLNLQDAHGQSLPSLPISNASIVPDSPFNLLSIRRLMREGAEFGFRENASYMRYQNHLFPLQLINGLYVLDLLTPLKAIVSSSTNGPPLPPHISPAPVSEYSCYAQISPTASADLWHKRCGHVSAARLIQLHKSGHALGLQFPGVTPHNAKCPCHMCMMNNNVSRSVQKARTMPSTVSRKGQLITSDVLGPFPPSPEGHRYAISYTDEYTRFSMVYFMRTKSEAPKTLLALIKYYEFMNITITEVRTDQGGEYGGHNARSTVQGGNSSLPTTADSDIFSAKFAAVCKEKNIQHTLMPAYRPELHAIAERWNRTVMIMANSMLTTACISPILWPEAVAHANLIRNKLPTKLLGDHTPYELFTGQLPRFDNLRVWGCYCYIRRSRLAVKSQGCLQGLVSFTAAKLQKGLDLGVSIQLRMRSPPNTTSSLMRQASIAVNNY